MLHATWSWMPGLGRLRRSPCFGSRQSKSSPGSLRCRGSRPRSLPPGPVRGVKPVGRAHGAASPGQAPGRVPGAERSVAGAPRAWARLRVEPGPPAPLAVGRPRYAPAGGDAHKRRVRVRAPLIGKRRRAPPPLRTAVPAGSLVPPPPPGWSPLGSGGSSPAGGSPAERDGQAVIPRRGQGR